MIKRIKVLHMGLSSNVGGIERVVYSWWKSINHQEIQFDFINNYGQKIAYEDEFVNGGGKIFYISSRHRNPIQYKMDLKRVLLQGEYDYIHCHIMTMSDPTPILLCEKLDIKTKAILHSHNVVMTDTMTFARKMIHILGAYRLKKARYLKLACGKMAGTSMFGEAEFNVIENGVDFDKFKFSTEFRRKIRNQYKLDNKTFLIGHVGRPGPQKNYPFLIKVFAELLKICHTAKLMLIGAVDNDSEVLNEISKYNIVDSVILTGAINNVNECYSAMDVFFLPSCYEGISVALIEAQTCGLPCVVSDNISRESAISENISFMPTDNVENIILELLKFSNDSLDARKNRMVNSAYDINHSAKAIFDYYKNHLS